MTRSFYLIPFIGLFLSVTACRPGPDAADTLFINGHIWTGDPENPWTSALAVRGEVLVHTGEKAVEWQGPNTRVVDLEGKLVVPGFIDNHTHFLGGGFQLANVDLRSSATPEAFIQRLADFAVLSENISEIEPERIREVQVERTVVGGEEVWNRRTDEPRNGRSMK
jgi:predicted amidohydrolase YtcJ